MKARSFWTTPSSEGVAIIGRSGTLRVMLLVLGVGLGFGLASGAEAQRMQERPNALEAERAISQLRSPYCPGFMLEVCTSGQAAALRDSIFMLAAEGMTAPELVEWMIANHGEEWRAVPQRSGAGLWAWIIPPMALLVGFGVLVGWIRASRGTRREETVGVAAPEVTDEDRARLAAAMREMEESGEEVV